jgi:hypothetical protein
MDVARQQGLPNNLAITEYAYVSVAIFRSLQAKSGAPEGPVAGKQDHAAAAVYMSTQLVHTPLECLLHKHVHLT